MADLLSCRASMPACSVSHGACCGLHLPLDGLSYSSISGALSLHLCMLLFRASRGGILSLCYASLSIQGSCYVLTLPLLFLTLPCPSLLILLISYPTLLLNPLAFSLSYTPAPIPLIVSLTSNLTILITIL